MIPENLTPDTNDVGELTMSLKVSFARLALEKEILDKILLKKVEELSKVVSPLDVYGKMVGLIREWALEKCEDVKVSDNDGEVVIYTPKGQHVGTKMKVLCTRAKSIYFYYQQSYDESNAKLKSRGWKGVASKQYEPMLHKVVTWKGVEFGASWIKDVDRVYMPINLDHLWVAVELNLIDGKIFVYDSIKKATHIRQAIAKLALTLTYCHMSSLAYQGI
ncbi:unnamed protein product [Malus baccata var. baccata]